MTTEVIVKANHGWPVAVRQLPTGGADTGWTQVVAAGAEQSFSVHSGADLLVHEVQPGADAAPAYPEEPIMKHFSWAHLPERLQMISRPFALLAARVVATSPRSAERSACLRKLLEAKDCAVRAALEG